MLGINFLETVSPYYININGILVTYNDKMSNENDKSV